MSLIRISRRQVLRGGVAVAAGVVAGPLVAGAVAGAYPWGGTLQQGSTGAAVKELQIRVAGWAASGASQTYVAVDGDFGPGTAAAVKRFQSAYGLAADGVAGSATQAKLNALEQSDGSTVHFDWSEFTDRISGTFDGGKVSASTAREYARRLMYKLEAVRVKIGNVPITVNSGFRSIQHNSDVGGASDSMHLYGTAADLAASVGNRVLYQKAESSGFSGLEAYTEDHQHVDSRAELGRAWWWQSGTI
ncbi:D-Ala-D-Ala carboxypeptidase family metallohydrolase [Actinocatenispora rupis]|uniref:Muramoylpentapeptide carboxypeptidase n=1 Tax=Actinocatenispora rupis TaxID=519421 RepID=A0A8J3JFT3_9ACTN|nr:D-Ala-D-Ala carboxypeptidase family metallohydrolase [Actinocatenispora rupis]GID15627.1 muramoylpentapeptide carboxypeptidase [Actinocatenispora rupis]